MKSKFLMIRNLSCIILLVVLFFVIVISGNEKEEYVTYNVSSINSIQAVHLVSKYNPKTVPVVYANNFYEVLTYGQSNPVVFAGTMTSYGPDCVGCTGLVACPPRNDVRYGNVYFDDQEYGKINILAADGNIPCGTIVKVKGYTNEEFVGIVLDRGGAIRGTLMDLLVTSEYHSDSLGRHQVTYEIVRWGW